MSVRNSLFEKVPIEIQKLNTFDMSHDTLGTGMVGSVIPVKVEEIMPNTTINLGVQSHFQLPPFVNNAYGRISVKQEAFFVPNRLLMGSAWQDYTLYNGGLADQYQPAGMRKRYIPLLSFGGTVAERQYAGTLFEYLYGTLNDYEGSTQYFSAFPLLAYWRIIDEWYRNPTYENPIFSRGRESTTNAFSYAPWLSYVNQIIWQFGLLHTGVATANGTGRDLWSFYQRNYGKDYFTNAYLNQNGGAQQVKVSLNSLSDGFTIQQLRAANSLQKFAEINAAAGGRYGDAMISAFGTCPSDAVLQRPIFLGRNVVDVYGNSVYQTSQNSDDSSATPWASGVGAKNGDRSGAGDGRLVDGFTTKEQGYLFVMQTLVPHAYYSTTMRRMEAKINTLNVNPDKSSSYTPSTELGYSDLYPIPALSSIGNEPIYQSEITGSVGNSSMIGKIYGWTPRYSSYKFNNDEVHGLLRDGESLSSFALKRGFTGAQTPQSVSKIRTTDLDDVTTVKSALSEYGYIFNNHWQEDHTCPLPAYTIPTLGEPKNTKTISVAKGGTYLNG